MKKVLALVLAVAMIASLSLAAFAAAPAYGTVFVDSVIGSGADMKYADIDAFNGMANLTLVPGDIVYIALGTSDSDDVKGIKLFTTNIMNLDAVETPTIVFTKLAAVENAYAYYAKIVVKASTAVASKDVSFDLKIGKTSSSPTETETLSFTVKNYENTAGYDDMAKDSGAITTNTTPLATAGVTTALPVINGPVCDFSDDEESLEFGDIALFEIDTNGQSTDLNLGWNTKFNSTVAAKYPDANIDFVSFVASPVFNRNGDLYIYADEDTYFYEVVNGEIKASKAVYDEDYGAFALKTRKLGAYAVSDKELKIAAPVVSSSAATAEKPNVNTGASADAAMDGKVEFVMAAGNLVTLVANSDTGILEIAAATPSQGKTVYYELVYDDAFETADMNKLKVSGKWSVGAELIKELKIEYKKINKNVPDPDVAKDYYSYVVSVATNKVNINKALDMVGDVKVYKISSSPYDEVTVNFKTLGTSDVAYVAGVALVPGTKALNFPAALEAEQTMEFEGVGEFEINVANQGVLYLGFNTDAVLSVIDQYPDANLEFVTFTGAPVFNKTGLFYMYADEGSFLYEIVDGKLVAKNAVYDDDYGALKFATKKLGSYVISDVELKLATVAPAKPVVNTGAAVSAVAIAMMAAAAAVVLKK